MRNKGEIILIITLILCFCSCKSSHIYSKKEINAIKKTDSILRAEKNIIIQDLEEEFERF